MKDTVTEEKFVRAFDEMGRSQNFTREARRALFEWYEEIERATGEEVELDPIAVCCEWSEYESLDEVREDENDPELTMEELKEKTTVIELEHSDNLLVHEH